MGHKRKLILFTSFVTVAVSIFCAVIIKKTNMQTLTVTDKDGVTYVAVIDQNSEVYAGVTGTDGTMYAAEIKDGVVMKDKPLYVVGDYSGTFPYNDTTRTDDISINQNNDEEFDFSGEAQTKASTEVTEGTTSSGEKEEQKKEPSEKPQEKKNPEEYLTYKFAKLFNSGIFAMTFTTDDPEMTQEITMALRNGSIYMDTTMEGIACKVLYDADKKTGYMIIPQLRVYCALPEDLAGDLATGDFNFPDIADAVRSETYDVTIDGKDCTCEEFEFSNGEMYTYYFYNGNLIRMVSGNDGDSMLYNIKSLTSDVDNSYFELPRGYLKVDLSWLETQGEL